MLQSLKLFLERFGHWLIILAFVSLSNLYFFIPEGRIILAGFIAFILGVFMLFRIKESLQLLAFFVPLTLPFSFNNGAVINIPSELMAVFLCPIFISRILMHSKINWNFYKHPFTILLLTDLVWMLLTSVTSELPMVSFKRCIVRFTYLSVYYAFFSEFIRDEKMFRVFFRNFCYGLIIPILNTFYTHSIYGFNPTVAPDAAKPFFNDHTIYGAVLALVIPYLYFEIKNSAKSMRLLFIALLILFLIAEFFSFSRAAWISLAALIPFYFLIRIRTPFLLLASLVIIIVSFTFYQREWIAEKFFSSKAVSHKVDTFQHLQSVQNISSDASNKERINRWKCALRMFNEKPLFGYGPGTYQFIYGQFQVRNEITYISTFHGTKGHAHNEFLNYLSENGLPGLIIFTLWVFYSLYLGLKNYYHSKGLIKDLSLMLLFSLSTFYIHSLFNGFIETDKMMMPVFIILALIVQLNIQGKTNAKQEESALNS